MGVDSIIIKVRRMVNGLSWMIGIITYHKSLIRVNIKMIIKLVNGNVIWIMKNINWCKIIILINTISGGGIYHQV